jgi:hypothetical protein
MIASRQNLVAAAHAQQFPANALGTVAGLCPRYTGQTRQQQKENRGDANRLRPPGLCDGARVSHVG